MTKLKEPEVGDIWIKGSYKTVGWPAGRVTITDVVRLNTETRIHYNYLAGTQAGQPKTLEMRAFQRMFLFGKSAAPELIPDPDAQPGLEFADHTEAYRGEEEI